MKRPSRISDPLKNLPSEAKLKQLQIVSSRLVESLLAGNYRSVFRGPGIEFDEVREYVEGDDTRLIDWNVTSRFGNVYTKTFREEREMTLFLIVDISPSLSFGSTGRSVRDVALIVSALLTMAAVHNNDKVGGVLFSDRIESWTNPAKGRRHALKFLQGIITANPAGTGSDLSLVLRTVGESLKRRGICLVVSDFQTTNYQRELSLLSRRHDVIAIRLSDPAMDDLPNIGIVSVADPETGKTLLLDGRSQQFRFQFQQFWQQQRQQWLRECRRRGVSALEISTVDQVASRLIAFFRRRGAR